MSGVYKEMKSEFDGYCSQKGCNAQLPAGTKRFYHRFARRIVCESCAGKEQAKEKPAAKSVLQDKVMERLERLEQLLLTICEEMDFDVSHVYPKEPQKEVKEAPKRPTAEEFVERFVQISQSWREDTPSFKIVDDHTVALGECNFTHFYDVKTELAKWGFRKGRVEVRLDGGRLEKMEIDVE